MSKQDETNMTTIPTFEEYDKTALTYDYKAAYNYARNAGIKALSEREAESEQVKYEAACWRNYVKECEKQRSDKRPQYFGD